MTPENFCYWLQGRIELHRDMITVEEWECIKSHLQLVFNKQTPSMPNNPLPQFTPSVPGIPPKIVC